MRIRADKRIGEINAVAFENALGKVFEIHLVNDADARRNYLEPVKCLRAPFEEAIPLVISLELHLHVPLICCFASGKVDLHGVIDDQVDRHKRLNDSRVLSHSLYSRAHCRQIDQQRHARKILQNDAGNDKRYLFGPFLIRLPSGKRSYIGFTDVIAIVKIAQD